MQKPFEFRMQAMDAQWEWEWNGCVKLFYNFSIDNCYGIMIR